MNPKDFRSPRVYAVVPGGEVRLAALGVKIGGAVLMAHSESGFYPEQAALVDPSGLQGLISMEPATCNASTLTAGQIAKLAKIPTLLVFGDHLADVPTTSVNWPAALDDCQKYVDAINAGGGDAAMLQMPDACVFGSICCFRTRTTLFGGGLSLAGLSRSLAPVLPLH